MNDEDRERVEAIARDLDGGWVTASGADIRYLIGLVERLQAQSASEERWAGTYFRAWQRGLSHARRWKALARRYRRWLVVLGHDEGTPVTADEMASWLETGHCPVCGAREEARR